MERTGTMLQLDAQQAWQVESLSESQQHQLTPC